ncbi:restriction endonuclease subunit S [Thiomicrorhabdus sp. Milos-T2]|uniref:restriction endonuclease subunit S n=1 Tax=Thiomicrorhabdus sp. Milos-T2 TaxID=90814 RepID=UPI00068C4F70|nr:restriction endonuclease subunit S [Thiomicrorhabdus sp. Milos-T2]
MNHINHFEKLPQGWKWLAIKDFGTTTSGGTPKRGNPEFYNGDVPWVKSGDLNNGILYKVDEYISELGLQKSSAKMFNPNTVLVAMYGATIGKLSILGVSASTNQAICGISLPESFEPKYLFYYLLSIKKKLIEQGQGGAQPNINQQIIKETFVPVAPPAQQKQIVAKIEELFSHIDAGIESLKIAKQKLKQYRQSILKAAVTGELTKDWREQNANAEQGCSNVAGGTTPGATKIEPANQLLKRILKERRQRWEQQQLKQFQAKGKPPKNEKWKEKYKEPKPSNVELLPVIPEEWVWVTLPQIGELNRGKSKHRPRNDPSLYGGKYPFVQTGDIRHANRWVKTYTQTYSEKGLSQSRLWPKGTLCITIAANIADTAILDFEACFPDSVVGFLPINDTINVEFVEFFIRTVKNDLEKFAPATAQKNINLAILETVSIPLVSEAEQKEVVQRVEEKLTAADRLMKEIETKLTQAQQQKQTILASAFKGELL